MLCENQLAYRVLPQLSDVVSRWTRCTEAFIRAKEGEVTEAICVISGNAACVEHAGMHNVCLAHKRCISKCWPQSERPTVVTTTLEDMERLRDRNVALEAEVRRLREALESLECKECGQKFRLCKPSKDSSAPGGGK